MQRRTAAEKLLIGAHTSAAGGAFHALLEGQSIGATTVQLFTANQRQWQTKELTEEGVFQFKEALKETGLKKIASHASYLINLGSPQPDALEKSRNAFIQEIGRCRALGVSFINVHPGAALSSSEEECLDQVADSLLSFEAEFPDEKTRILLETTAGQGSSIGYRFEQLGYILEKVRKRVPVGICIDTCHIFVAGYDIRTPKGWEETLQEFDEQVGLKHLYAFHINDSDTEFGSRADRHAPLGEGKIGLQSFKFLMRSPLTREIPKYLETPGGPPAWVEEIALLREYAKAK
jgi:deoxyribonuclease IV